ncbi:MAG: aspartate/tyrosine/aromatic aminotransferase [Amphritea sp.]|nr:aspartate/tyrosine/aromatic aminotransferase [Amphritea sp.]
MFEGLQALPQDPILGLMLKFRDDTNPDKLDLGVGVYKDEQGNTPIMAAVHAAEAQLLTSETTKTYIGPAGSELFNQRSRELVFGSDRSVIKDNRIASAQTPGGCGALRMAAEFIRGCSTDSKVWVSTPTWANHIPLLGGAGVPLKEYPYYDYDQKSIQFDAMMATLEQATKGDYLLLHGCCHNPSGADLNRDQWQAVAELCSRKGIIPFIDMAYQGLGNGIDEDAHGVRLLADTVPEMLVATSCSKNFGLYRERTGTLFVVAGNAQQAAIAGSQLFNKIRGHYSMPPSHGAAIVETILSDNALTQQWQDELQVMRERIQWLRDTLVERITAAGVERDFNFIRQQYGMFSFLGITAEQVAQLQQDYSIYMVDSSRMNVAGLNTDRMDYFVSALAEVLHR